MGIADLGHSIRRRDVGIHGVAVSTVGLLVVVHKAVGGAFLYGEGVFRPLIIS